jgi:hypothetical protein
VKLSVLKYSPNNDYHECEDEKGIIHRVDLLINGDFAEQTKNLNRDELDAFCSSFEGKTIVVEYLHPFIEIAHGVIIVP